MLIRIRRSKIYCNHLDSSNAVVCSHRTLKYTVRLAIINAVELERNGCFFFTSIEECCVVIEKNIDKSLQIELVTKYATKVLKRKVW